MATACFFPVAPDSPFSIQNLPYGVFRPSPSASPRPGVAIGDHVLDLSTIASAGLFDGPLLTSSVASECFLQPNLNNFMAKGRPLWKETRSTLQKLLSGDDCRLRDDPALQKSALIPMSDVQMVLPAAIGDYTDFFSSEYHTRNCSMIFRGESGVPPNWLHLPVAYHGRASSVVISGTDVIRPKGQSFPPKAEKPCFGPSARLDYELEMAFFVGPGNKLGHPVAVENAHDHIFGFVLMNDWSARDIQIWEAQPLGPFLGKSFATTISPWIITLEALEPFKCEAPKQDPPCLPYLAEENRFTYDIPIEVGIRPEGVEKPSIVCRSNFKHLYWTVAQQLAHHTINGCNLRPGDLLASGTISGPDKGSLGCLLEQSWGGSQDVPLEIGGARKFLEDGDEVIFSGCCKGDGFLVGFGTCAGKVLPSI